MRGSLRDFRALVYLDEARHFGRAAEKLGVSQPQLSELLARMESSLGFRLFTRRPQVRPTAAGVVLVKTARNVLAEVQKGVSRAERELAGTAGHVRIGFVVTAMLTDLADTFSRFRKTHTEVEIVFKEGHSRELEMSLEEGTLDIVFVRSAWLNPRANRAVVVQEPYVAIFCDVGDQAWPEKTGTQPLVLFPRDRAPSFYDEIMRVVGDAGLRPTAIRHVEGWHSTLALVRSGFGMTVGPACLRQLHWSRLAYRDLSDLPARASITMLWHEAKASPAVRAFVHLAKTNF